MAHGTQRRIRIRELITNASVGNSVVLTGWVKTARFSKNISFVHVMDGSTPSTIQVILKAEDAVKLKPQLGTGTAVRIEGSWVASPGGKQDIEVVADSVEIVGGITPEYPMQSKRISLEHLRTLAHLRSRTNTHQAVIRVRNALSWQIHKFFQDRGFQWIHTPIITSSDAEGAGELFQLSTDGSTDDFFGHDAFLTVSGQLQVECFAQSHTDVYTFGPTFRAENSNTPRHAAEFWMIEPEIAFANLDDVIALATDFVQTVANGTIEQCPEDFAFFDKFMLKGALAEIKTAINKDFARITYTEAQEILAASGVKFDFPIGWGESLQAEHEKYLTEEHFKGPVFVTDYPTEQKAFYMRQNDDGKTMAATDLLVPRVGEMLGGSQREERLGNLESEMSRRDMDPSHLDWYLDLRRWGTTPHGGFGLGFERMLMWLTGM
ncbi:MAG: asparagine--tRNA ligase [Rhodobacterales bacterium]|nr:asparagine--tRNA ligase [Rhodobacterales bacterium]